MKKSLQQLTMILIVALSSLKGFAQSFTATYDFANVTSSSGRTDPTPPPLAPGLIFGTFSAVAPTGNPYSLGASPNAAGRFSFQGWPTGATNNSDVFTGTINTSQYYQVTVTPRAYYTLNLDSITFTLQRSGTGIRQFSVRSSLDGYAGDLPATIDPLNASLQVVSGNIFQVSDASTTANDGSKVILGGAGFTNISSQVTFRFYGFNSEASGGTFSIDNVKFSGSATLSPTAPNIILNKSVLSFPATSYTASTVLNYTVKGDNLSSPVTVTTSSPYEIADALNGTYSNTMTLQPEDISTSKTIYVKFTPGTIGTFAGTITHSNADAETKTISLSGDGIDPNNLTFNFDNCSSLGVPGQGFTSYSVTGPQKWACSNFGRSSTHGIDINGYSGGAQENEDWLISPPLNISSLDLPVLRFWSKGDYTGPSLQLLISTNYDGMSNPNSATWTDLNANFPPLNSIWTMTDGIELSAYKATPVYIAFKYISNEELGAARFTIDDIDITNRTQLLSASPLLLNFDEVSTGNHSQPLQVSVKAVGFGDVTLTAPAGYNLSLDNTNYSTSVVLDEASLPTGTTVFARFSPTSKALKIQGLIHFSGTSLDSNLVTLTGTSYPKAETFDAGCYNLSFFGSNATNNATQAKIDLQVANIATVINKLNLDVLGIEEVSNDVALDSLVKKLSNRKALLSNRWSYSFNAPDPNFPPQKTGFIYDTTTMKLVSSRDMFVEMYDKARTTNPELLPNYPGGTPSSFWASGRLPFMATFDATINGITERIVIIDVHAKSASDVASYNRRVYDVKVLKDSLDAYYAGSNVIIVGDYNDRVLGSIYAGSTISPYKPFVDDSKYNVLTLPLDQAGRVSFLTGTGLIDHITVSSAFGVHYIQNSTDIEDPRSYIASYNATTASDHMPVYSRFSFTQAVPVTISYFNAQAKGKQVNISWSTSSEFNNDYFVVERSMNGRTFNALGMVKSAGKAGVSNNYQLTDSFPLTGINYYRLKQVDRDGSVKYSSIVAVNFSQNAPNALVLYPNPVSNHVQIKVNAAPGNYSCKLIASDGRVVMNSTGDIKQINNEINQNLYKFKAGIYVLKITNGTDEYFVKFIKQ